MCLGHMTLTTDGETHAQQAQESHVINLPQKQARSGWHEEVAVW